VQDPFLEFRSGPGRGYPCSTSWTAASPWSCCAVAPTGSRCAARRQGGLGQPDAARTHAHAEGGPVTVPGPGPESRTAHRWRRASPPATSAARASSARRRLVGHAHAARACRRRAAARRLLRRLAGHGGRGPPVRAAVARLAVRRHRRRRAARRPQGHADPGRGAYRRGRLPRRRPARLPLEPLLLQAEYRSYVVFTDRDDNEEIAQWTVAFTYFF